jgi:hypothetical protein
LTAGAALGDVVNRHSGGESVYDEGDADASGRVVVESFQDLYSSHIIRGFVTFLCTLLTLL